MRGNFSPLTSGGDDSGGTNSFSDIGEIVQEEMSLTAKKVI